MEEPKARTSRSKTVLISAVAFANLVVLLLMALAQVSMAAGNESPLTATSSISDAPVISATTPDYARNYYWTWYDNKSMQSWVMMANPSGGGSDMKFDLMIDGSRRNLVPYSLTGPLCPNYQCQVGQVPEGMTLAPSFAGLMGGPVKASSLSGDKAVVSQRSLMGNSFEEVLGTEAEKLSDHFYWTWYDQQTPGYADWVLVANPGDAPVYYEITIGGNDPGEGSKGTIEPGKNATPAFPGQMGGPLEVRAWASSDKSTTAKVMASQRVLSNYGTAFNEVPGIPAEELKDHYLWTWYDSVGSSGMDWVLIANPGDTSVYYEVTIAGEDPGEGSKGTIDPGQNVTPTFPNEQRGPLEVRTWVSETYPSGDPNEGQQKKAMPANTIASQRIVWGPSFEEVPGYPAESLASEYHWTWYDQQSPGASNWVMVSNPNQSPVYYEITLAGQSPGLGSKGTIDPGKNQVPTFAAQMGGPLAVKAWTDQNKTTPANIMVSQRVTWNGFFNEVLGTVLDPPLPPVVPGTTKVLDKATSDRLSSISQDGTQLIFTGTSQQIAGVTSLSIGDSIVIEPCAVAPYGLLRKIEGIQASAGQITLITIQATLDDALDQGSLRANTDELTTPVGSVALTNNTLQVSSFGLGSYEVSLNKTLYEENGKKIDAAGTITITPSFDLETDINWSGIRRVKFVDNTTETANLAVTATGSIGFNKKWEVWSQTLPAIRFVVGAPPVLVPVWITPVVRVYIGADGSVSSSVTTGVTQKADFTAGIEYDRGNWRTIQGFNNSFTWQPPTLSAGASLKAYARPQLDLMLYGITGPYVFVDGYLKLEANPAVTPWWKLYAGLDAGAGVKLDVLGFKLSHDASFNIVEKVIARADNTTNSCAASMNNINWDAEIGTDPRFDHIEKVIITDIDLDGEQEAIIQQRLDGSGGYFNVFIFTCDDGKLSKMWEFVDGRRGEVYLGQTPGSFVFTGGIFEPDDFNCCPSYRGYSTLTWSNITNQFEVTSHTVVPT